MVYRGAETRHILFWRPYIRNILVQGRTQDFLKGRARAEFVLYT